MRKRHAWSLRAVCCAFGGVIGIGCGGSAVPGGPADPGSADAGRDAAPAEVVGFDIVFPGDAFDRVGAVEPDSPRADVADASSPLKPCSSGGECESGFCISLVSGEQVCAPLCLDNPCPTGWECRPVTNTGGDIVFICVPLSNRLCRPCRYHEDCRQPGIQTNDLCVDRGPSGKFCGRDCSSDGSCPDGYSCTEVPVEGAEPAHQCVPASGECECTPEFIENGFETPCYVQNEFGTCVGMRRCAAQGLTACDAKTPEPEVCNGFDENCDGQTDEGIPARECEKTFGEIVCKGPEVCEGGTTVCKAQEPGPEKCDGLDNDCDGTTDPPGVEGCTNFYRDEDGDAYGTSDFRCLCAAIPPHTALVPGDCDDASAEVHPGVAETCNGRDDDCDGATDEEGAVGCGDRFRDEDGDGFGVPGDKKCLCAAVSPYMATQAGDCDDTDAAVHPGVPESCNGRDDDCDGVKDPEGASGCANYYYDHDADGFGVAENPKCLCAPQGKYTAQKPGDCDDTDGSVYPGRPESCNNRDDDCDAATDEDFPLKGQPCDGPDADFCKEGVYFCNAAGTGLDCSDLTDATVEVCNNADDDCDGLTDEDLYQSCSSPCGVGTETCVAGKWQGCSAMQPKWCTNYQTCGLESLCVTSCPAAPPEQCNSKDDDCDGLTDEDLTRACSSMCGSGFETCQFGQWANCTAPLPRTCLNYNNCQTEPMCVSSCPPAPSETCNNRDDNCNGQVDENLIRTCSTICGSGTETCVSGNWINCTAPKPIQCMDYGTCTQKDFCGSSCPSAPAEICNLKDDNCNGLTDEGYEGDDGCTNCGDFPNAWFGPDLYDCMSGSCSGNLQARILPKADVDYFSVFKDETNDWIVSLKGQVFLTSPSGVSYMVCACWSQNTQCDQSGTQCAVSSGVQVSIQVENGDSWGSNDAAYLDIWVTPVSSSDYSCSFYSIAWSVWE